MKQFAVTDEKIFHVYKAFDRKSDSHADMRTSQAQRLGKGCQHERKDPKIKFCHKKSASPVKKSR